jgi:hypothetical protein
MRQIRRLAVTSVDQLIDAITRYLDRRNENPVPFKWTANAEDILRKVRKLNRISASQH